MSTDVSVGMPKLSDSMEEGTLLAWLVEDGTEVARGQEIAEIETDKATMTMDAPAHGVITLLAEPGSSLAVGDPMATIGDVHSPKEARDEPEPARARGERSSKPERLKASPLARRIARDMGVELDKLAGTGPGGRIVRRDVQLAAEPASGVPRVAPPPPSTIEEQTSSSAPPVAGSKGEVEVRLLTRVQQTVARRMAEAKATAPEFTLDIEVDMDASVALREQLKMATSGPVPSFNDFVIKAAALALRAHPVANGAYRDGAFELYERVNVGFAVAGENALVVPTVLRADQKSLGQIATETRALAERVRAGTITPPELAGGTFTVSNLGMFGIRRFTAVLNPPQAAILAVGALEERPVVRDGELTVARRMDLTLTCDHRILYGAQAAQFLGTVRSLLEQPLGLAL